MAHGFLSYEEVSGDRFWQNAKWLGKQLDKIRKAKIWPLSDKKIVNVYVSELQNLLVSGQQKKMAAAPQTRMLGAGSGDLATRSGGLTEKNPTDIDVKTGKRLPPGGPRLPGSAGGPSKGGGFTDIPGISSGGLNTENFFSKAVGYGVDASTGQYLSREDRIAAFKAGKVDRNTSQGPSISPDSGVDIVAAVNRNTQMIVSLVDAVKEQTKIEVQLSEKESQNTEKLMLRAAARQEESDLEKGKDLSGFLTPERFKKKEKNSGGGGGGDDSLLDFLDVGLDLLDIGGGRKGKGGRSRVTTGRGGKGVGKGGGIARSLGKASKGGGLARGAAGLGKGLLRNAGPLALLGGAFEFSGRKAEGQSNLQAGVGTAASVAGGLAGAAKGAAMGAALGSVVPGLGTAVGGILGGLIGGFGGSALAGGAADLATGAFANGGLITQPTLSLMGEGNKAEGVFPLEGTKGKKTFKMFGEGIFQAQKDNDADFAKLQAKGFKQYYETEGGFKKMGEGLKDFFAGLGGAFENIFNTLTGGAANAGTLDQAGDYLNVGGGGTAEQNLAAFTATLEGGSGQNAADALQVMLNRAANAQQGGSMKAYGTTLGDQVMGQAQFSPISAVLYDGSTGDPDADRVYGGLRAKLGKTTAERKKKLLEIAAQGPQALQQFFGKGSASAADQLLTDFRGGGQLSQSAASGVQGRLFFKGQSQLKNKKAGDFYRGTGGNFFHGSAGGTVGTLSSVSPGGGMEAPDPEAAAAGGGANVVSVSHPDTGSGYSVAGLKDAQGRPVVMSRGGAVAFARMMKDSKGQVKGSDVASSQRSAAKNKRVGGVPGSKHLKGNALDIHGTSQAWMRKHGAKYGWHINDYPGSHGGHFDFKGGGSAMRAPATTAGGGGGTPAAATSPRASSASSPGSLQASAANANDGTSMMASSQQVAMGTMGLTTQGGGATIINNYYGGGQSGGVNPNGVSAGIGMDQTGTSAFQPLKIMALT